MSSATIFAKLLAIFLLLQLVQGEESSTQQGMQCVLNIKKPGSKCVDNEGACQPDGSLGNCCSGFCHKEPDWDTGYCE